MKKEDLLLHPLKLFENMWQEVAEKEFENGQTLSLATVGSNSQPSLRNVLFKKITGEGVHFFTNYNSRKAKEIEENPNVSAMVYWISTDVQFRFDGRVEKLSQEDSDAYFSKRHRESQMGAWASKQSQVLSSREEFDKKVERVKAKFLNQDIPRPEFWGGYILKPKQVQILQRKDGRLHDSFVYDLQEDGEWSIFRLNP